MIALKYSFKPQDMNNWKGRITESLTTFYIRDVLAPKLKTEGWNEVLFLRVKPSLDKPTRPVEKLPPYLRSVYREKYKWFKRILVSHEWFPNQELLERYGKLIELLEITPDGFLIKLKKTGKMKPVKDVISEFGLGRWMWSDGDTRYELSTEGLDETAEIPVVTGEIEIVEVKSDKGKLAKNQKKCYSNAVKSGYPLRLFHVSIVSSDGNHFEVKHKLVQNENDIKKGVKIFINSK